MSEEIKALPSRPGSVGTATGRRVRRPRGRSGRPGSAAGTLRLAAGERVLMNRLLQGARNMTGEQVRSLRRRIYEPQAAGEASRETVREAQAILTALVSGSASGTAGVYALGDRDLGRATRRRDSAPLRAARKLVSEALALDPRTCMFSPLPDLLARQAM